MPQGIHRDVRAAGRRATAFASLRQRTTAGDLVVAETGVVDGRRTSQRGDAGSGRRNVAVCAPKNRSIAPESPDGRVDAKRQLPEELGGDEEARRAGLFPQVEQHAYVPDQQERPSDQTEPGHAPRDETGAVHQVAEDQSVPDGNDEAGAEEERPVLELSERDGEVG